VRDAPGTTSDPPPDAPFDPGAITRPDPALQTYYFIIAGLTVVGFPFIIIPLLIRYHTLRYTFDDTGVSMSWGILWRREIVLTYRRIQDIHVTRNVIERWMGLAKVAIQTASGAADDEMTIEGVKRPELLRDHLYARMRGARDDAPIATTPTKPGLSAAKSRVPTTAPPTPDDDLLTLLTDIRDEIRRLRAAREPDRDE